MLPHFLFAKCRVVADIQVGWSETPTNIYCKRGPYKKYPSIYDFNSCESSLIFQNKKYSLKNLVFSNV